MPIRFQCEQCGHTIEVDDHLGGKHGKCKHCGHSLVVPTSRVEEAGPALRLRPLAGEEPSEPLGKLLNTPPPLKVRAAEADPRIIAEMISDADEPPLTHGRPSDDYVVTDPYQLSRAHSSTGPPPLWTLLPRMSARWLARNLRTLRNWLYVASVGFLVLVLIGYLFQWKTLLHLGALGVVASNVSMLYVGVAYLISLPFKEGLRYGLANLLIPFYAIYYWSTRWNRMKTAVYKTVGSFLPIALVGLAYLIYEEAPVVEAAIERKLPGLEQRIERATAKLEAKADTTLGPIEERVGPLLKPEPPEKGRRHRSAPE
ncbi:hypothetical protein SAMN05444166_5652 [Singulisphaera sp. GP187]|uniref:zinc ribbon domain-containing protein n=1 Tax=Singulisphaera sp. GP187 TaxID=1882752 RepID=UPI00092AB68B|nr:zinc ribbon domain-containing protein [Singulisphaera sp. GP187]SIO58364.1 hypothetical protein SAMN05444166_5652 [Singulisphaera sp. GP187]